MSWNKIIYVESPVSGEMFDMLSSNNNQTVYCNAVSSSNCIQKGELIRFGKDICKIQWLCAVQDIAESFGEVIINLF